MLNKARIILSITLILFLVLSCKTTSYDENNKQQGNISPHGTEQFINIETPFEFPETLVFIPFPTLDYDVEVDDEFYDFMIDNGGCNLPCWWGIEPGKTTWPQAWQTIAEIAITEGEYKQKVLEEMPQEGETTYLVYFNVSEDIWSYQKYGYPYYQAYQIINDGQIIKLIRAYSGNSEIKYSIPDLLTQFGKPDNIFLGSWFFTPHPYVYIELFYPKEGILATYEADVFWEDDIGKACFDKGPQFDLWDPANDFSLDELRQLDNFYALRFRAKPSLFSVITGITVEEFYQMFKNSNDVVCLDI